MRTKCDQKGLIDMITTKTKNNYTQIKSCRISDSRNLIPVLDLGHQTLTGVFPQNAQQSVTTGPLELVWSPDSGLLQLNHSYEPSEIYGDNYGYRSGLNQSMVNHLTNKIASLEQTISLKPGDVVVDIGSNDCTTLKAYTSCDVQRIGIDPTGHKFSKYYPKDVTLVPDFFSAEAFKSTGAKQAKIITSIAMFYDLEAPIQFAREIASILDHDGLWHFEQSYMPSMLRLNSYDTICHEHLEYYSLNVVKRIVEQAGLRLVNVTMNATNGGSFAVTAAKQENTSIVSNDAVINWLLEQENRMGLNTPQPYLAFQERVLRHKEDLQRLIQALNADGKKILGYGASTKGNVVLQYCGLTAADIPAIAEVNADKFGCVTPGTHIPIISEAEARAMKPDYFLVLPWHFKTGILQREKEFLQSGGQFIFPFPEIEII
jgi:hypothetical protein